MLSRLFKEKNLPRTTRTTRTTAKRWLKNAAYLLLPVVMLLSVGIIALTQEDPFQVNDFTEDTEEGETDEEYYSDYEDYRVIPEWVKPARWFRSNSGGMPIEEMKSRIAAMRGEYALVIDFTNSDDLPEYLLEFFDDSFFIEVRTLYKEGEENRVQWIFRDENYGVRLIAVLFDPEQETEEDIEAAFADDEESGGEEIEVAEAPDEINDKPPDFESFVAKVRKREPASGFIEIYDEKYNLTEEYRYTDKGEKSKIEYFYNGSIKTSSLTTLWDDDKEEYLQLYTDYYRYNRSAFLRAVERVFMTDQQITITDNIITGNDITGNDISGNEVSGKEVASNVVKVSFPSNILAAARNELFMGEKFNAYPDFFGDLFVLKDSKLTYTTDSHGRVLEQTLTGNDEEQTVIWKIVNTWSDDRIVKITKTEGETVLLAEYEYNRKGERVLERNIKDGVLERVVRAEGSRDIEELYLNDKLVLRAVWEDGRKISESRIIKN